MRQEGSLGIGGRDVLGEDCARALHRENEAVDDRGRGGLT